MFGRILMTLGLAMLLAAPAHAGFGLVLPDSPIVDDPEKTSLNLVICAIDPATGAGIPIERPQVFTALRYSGDNMDRSEHLSASIRPSSPTLPSRKIPTRRRRTTRPSPRPKSRISSPRRSPFPPSATRSRSKPTARASSRSPVRSPAGGLSRPAWPAIPSKIPKASRSRWKSRPFSGST